MGLTFSAPVRPISLVTAELSLTRTTDGGTFSLPVGSVLTVVILSPTVVRLEGLSSLTAADGLYRLRLHAGTVFDMDRTPLAADAVEEWRMDTAGPLVAAVGPILPDPRVDAVETVDVRFSEPISPTTFTADDLALTSSGRPLSLAGVTTTRVSDTVFRIGGLGPLTAGRGTYQLTVSPAGITDMLGNAGDRAFARSETWQVVTRVIPAAVGPVAPALRRTPVEWVDVRFTEPISATTFTPADLTLTRDGRPVGIAEVQIEALGASRFRVSGLGPLTAESGAYRLTVDAAGVLDEDDGVAGSGSAWVGWTADMTTPAAALSAGSVDAAGGADHMFNVVYEDNLALDDASIGTGDVTVSGPGGYTQAATLVGVTAPSPTRRIAIYRIAAPGGSWDASDNGIYQVTLAADAVLDAAGNSTAAGQLGSFRVAAPAVFVVRQYLTVVGVDFIP